MCHDSNTLGDRFWSKVDKTDDCWIWTAGKNHYGYGSYRLIVNGRSFAAQSHRLSYEDAVGPIPDGMVIDHLCRTPACVNPAHMEVVSRGENVLRGESSSAKHARGENCGRCASCVNAIKTHCVRGHLLDGDNLYVANSGMRVCRACAQERRSKRRSA